MSAICAGRKPRWAGRRVGEIVVWLEPSARGYLAAVEFGEVLARQRRIALTERRA